MEKRKEYAEGEMVKSSPVPGVVGMTLTAKKLPTGQSASPAGWSSPSGRSLSGRSKQS